jgi:hypothetical protein
LITALKRKHALALAIAMSNPDVPSRGPVKTADRLVELAVANLKTWLVPHYEDFSNRWIYALEEECVQLHSYVARARKVARECPATDLARQLEAHADRLEQLDLEATEPPPSQETGPVLESFELGEVVVSGTARSVVDLTVAFGRPREVSVSFGGKVYRHEDSWRLEPLLSTPEVKFVRKTSVLRFVAAPQGSSTRVAFMRLEQIRRLVAINAPAPISLFGFISDSEKLSILASYQGYAAMLV